MSLSLSGINAAGSFQISTNATAPDTGVRLDNTWWTPDPNFSWTGTEWNCSITATASGLTVINSGPNNGWEVKIHGI